MRSRELKWANEILLAASSSVHGVKIAPQTYYATKFRAR